MEVYLGMALYFDQKYFYRILTNLVVFSVLTIFLVIRAIPSVTRITVNTLKNKQNCFKYSENNFANAHQSFF